MKSLLLNFLLLNASLWGQVTFKTVCTSGCDYAGTFDGFQTALNDAAASSVTTPYVIEVEAGLTLSDATDCYIVAPTQTTKKLIISRSSRLSELPEGTRVTESDTAKLVTVENACSASPGVIIFPPSTSAAEPPSNYIFQGFEFYYSGTGRNAGGAVNIGLATDGSTKARTIAQLPKNIVMDRVWAHGISTQTWVTASSTHANQNGFLLNGLNLTVKDSRSSDNNMDSTDHGQGESHGVLSDNGTVLTLINNHIDGAIGSITGGGWVWIAAMMPASTNCFGNYYTRDPWAWHWLEWDTTDTLDLTQPCVTNAYWEQKVAPLNKYLCSAGSWGPTATTRPNRTWTKNGWECKNCNGVIAEGNVIYQIPSTGDQSQFGFSFLINNVDAQDSAFYARPQNIDIRFNLARRTAGGITLSGGNNANLLVDTNNVKVRHNIHDKFAGSLVSPTQGTELTTGGGTQMLATEIQKYFTFINNTFIYDRDFGGTGMRIQDEVPLLYDVFFRDNIFSWGVVGQSPVNTTTENCSSFAALLTGSKEWNFQGMVDTNARGSVAWNNIYGGANCPTDNVYAADWNAVNFVDFNGGEGGDYTLCTGVGTPDAACTGASPFVTASSTGGPLGADFTNVSYATSGVISGTADYNFFRFKIRRADQSEIRYTSYSSATCSGSIVDVDNIEVDSWTDGGGNNRERTHTPSGLSNGYHRVIVTCAGRWKDAEFVKI